VLHFETERFTLVKKLDMETNVNNTTEPQHDAKLPVSDSVLFGYRFTITSNQDGSTLGTGFMTSSKALDKNEQKDLFHNWTHGKYLKSENYVSVSVFQAER
jgi:hypothetical protein